MRAYNSIEFKVGFIAAIGAAVTARVAKWRGSDGELGAREHNHSDEESSRCRAM